MTSTTDTLAYIGAVAGIIGMITGVVGSVLGGMKAYRKSNSDKAMDLRIRLQTALRELTVELDHAPFSLNVEGV